MDILNKESTVTYYNNPYPIWIIDNFFKNEVLDKLKKEWPDSDSKLWSKGHKYINGKENILEQGMRAISKLENMPEYTSNLIEYLHSKNLTEHISNITNYSNLIPDSSMRWSGLRVMLPNSFQAIHSDARKNPETGFRKELTCLVYLNENYNKEKDKGCFEVWNDQMSELIHEIEPINNRLVIFLNTDKSYHGVPEVNFERKAILWSILKDGKSEDRNKALFVSRPQDSKEIGILGKERAYIKDAKNKM